MSMYDLKAHYQEINHYANFFDMIGEYEKSDLCYERLKALADHTNKKIRTANRKSDGQHISDEEFIKISKNFLKVITDPFLQPFDYLEKKVIRPTWTKIKEIGHEIDKAVRKNIPGGWATVVLVAASAGYLGPQATTAVRGFFSEGGTLSQALESKNPIINAAANTLLNMGVSGLIQGVNPKEIQSGNTPGYNQTAEIQFVNMFNAAYTQLRNTPAQADRQKKFDEIKKKLPEDFKKLGPQYANIIQQFSEDIKNKINKDYPNAPIK